MQITSDKITGVILAGGESRRMAGQDKGLIKLAHIPMLEYIIKTFNPQVSNLIINANRNHEQYAKYGLKIITDELSGFCGPLAGMAATLPVIDTEYMVTVPCDSPFIPDDLVARLSTALLKENADISVAHSGERLQPVFCLLSKAVSPSLNTYLKNGERKIDRWFAQQHTAIADFSDIPETFDNINTPIDLEHALSKLDTH